MWRTMFSISTMASSTRIPVDKVMARKLTRLSEKPRMSIAQNAGKIDSGSEIAAMMVARMSRKKRGHIVPAEFFGLVARGGLGARVVFLSDRAAAAGEVAFAAARVLTDVDCGRPRGRQPVRGERHQDFAPDTADTLDLGDVAH